MRSNVIRLVALLLVLLAAGCAADAGGEADEGTALAPSELVTSGLKGTYYAGTAFQTAVTSRVDGPVDFDWGTGSPAAGVPADGFSVRWTGQILPRYSETYAISTTTDDGVRVWIDGKLVIDDWALQAATERVGTAALIAGKPVDVRIDYFENLGHAVAKLAWASPSQPKQIIPASQLSPYTSTDCDAAKAARRALVPGTYRPGATTTGPVACVPLQRHDGDLTITAANTVIEGLDVYGAIVLGKYATNVTIRNSIVRGPVATSTAYTFQSSGLDMLGLVLEDSRIDLSGRENWFRDGIDGANFTVRRTEIKRAVDGVGLNLGKGMVTVEASWIHDCYWTSWAPGTPGAPSQPDYQTHNDGIQFQRGAGYVVRGNFIGGERGAGKGTGDDYNNSALMIGQSVDGTAANHLGTTLVEKNWFQGGAATINLHYSNGNTLGELTIRDNRFLHDPGYYILRDAAITAKLSNNVFDDTGAPVPIAVH